MNKAIVRICRLSNEPYSRFSFSPRPETSGSSAGGGSSGSGICVHVSM